MKVISQKVKDVQSKWPKRVICENCRAELEIEADDVFVGEFGCYLFKCPCCEHNTAIDGIERDTPPTFTQTFWHTSADDGAVYLSDEKVQEMIDECVRRLIDENVEPGEYTMQATCNTAVYAFKFEDCIDILVTQDYWEDSVSKEDYHLIRG